MTQSLVDRHDVELAALAAAGGRREFGELVRRHGSAVRGLLRRMGAQPSLADDIAQDAFTLFSDALGLEAGIELDQTAINAVNAQMQ